MELTLSLRADVLGEARQRFEDAHVVLVVGAHLEAIALRDDERDLEDVDRVEAEALAVERRLRVDRFGSDVQIQRFDEERGDLALQGGMGERHSGAGKAGKNNRVYQRGRSRTLIPPARRRP